MEGGLIGRQGYKTLGRCTHIHSHTQARQSQCKNAKIHAKPRLFFLTDGPHELDLDAEVLQLLPRHQHHLHHAGHALFI